MFKEKCGEAAHFSFDPVKANPLVLLTRHKTSSKIHGALRGGVSLFANSEQPFPLHSLLSEKEKIRIGRYTDFFHKIGIGYFCKIIVPDRYPRKCVSANNRQACD